VLPARERPGDSGWTAGAMEGEAGRASLESAGLPGRWEGATNLERAGAVAATDADVDSCLS